MYKNGTALLLAGLLASPIWSQEEAALDPRAELAEYARYAESHNPKLKQALARYKAALEKVAPASAWADPRLTYGYFARPVETRTGPQEMRFSAAQTFPWKGKLDLKGRIAQQEAEVEAQRYEVTRRSLIFEVKAAYYDYYFLQRAIAVTEENLRLLAHLEEVGRARYRGGTGEHAPVLKAQVELGRLEDQLRSLRQRQRPATARLNAALGRSATAPIAVPDSLPMPASDLDEEVLKARLQAANPTLQMRQVQARAQSLGVELAGKQFYPDLTVSLDYIHIGGDRGENPLMAMASLNLPLWRSSYEAGERAAKLGYQAALQGVADEKNRLAAELELALYKRRDAQSRSTLYRDSLLPKAEQALNVTQRSFAADRSDFLAVIDAQRTLLEFQLAYERARTDQALHGAEIEKLVGEPSTTEEIQR